MNEENNINYYSVIPATVRYDPDLKPAEKLLYSEITALANKNGYCFAQNKYFAELYNVTNGTVSKWFAHLQRLGYINIEIKRNEKQEIIARNIYIVDTPYGQKELYPYGEKRPYPYSQKEPYPMVKNVKDNNINNNIHDLFILIINKDKRISEEFYSILEKLDFLYTEKIIQIMQEDKIKMIADIKRVITSIAMPLGGVLIFASVVVAALKMIANSNNPQKRAESIGSLAWICGSGVILGASLIIAGIIINIATNNTGNLLGGR